MNVLTNTGPVDVSPLDARLAVLLPAFDDAMRAPVAQAVVAQVQRLVLDNWRELLQRCARGLPPGPAASVRSTAFRTPEPDLLMARLHGVVTPAVLLSLRSIGQVALTAELLAHPDVRLREQALDAMVRPGTGCEPLDRACAAWSRRMLIAELGHAAALSHTDRLGLQDELLADRDPSSDEPDIQTLGEALRVAANRTATMILAERAGVALDIAEAAIALRDPRMLLALCWNAKCSPAEALAVQVQLGRIPPGEALRIGPSDRWPLDSDALQWQIGVLQDI